MKNRSFQIVRIGDLAIQFEVMIYGGEVLERQPLLILNSIEFPVPPSVEFCEIMWRGGYQPIFVLRPGYGLSSPLPQVLMEDEVVKSRATLAAEAALIRGLIKELALRDPVLLAMGSANPVAYRLVHMIPDLALAVFANPMFNQEIWKEFEPSWLRSMLQQVMTSRSSVRVANRGLLYSMRRDPVAFYKIIFQKCAGDIAYVEANSDDYVCAARRSQKTTSQMLYYDAISCLTSDDLLKDSYFDGVNAVAVAGAQASEFWRQQMAGEAERLGLPLALAPVGHLTSAFASPEALLDLIHGRAHSGLSVAG